MPILPAEPAVFPDDLFEATSSADGADRRWWVLHTKPRQEKALSRRLFEQQLPYFLPLQRRRTLMRGRAMTSYAPLFPSYVFQFSNEQERGSALATGRVVQTLPVTDQQRLWTELNQIHRLLDSGRAVAAEQGLTPGALVEICSGPLTGLRGKILTTASGRRFVVQVDFIQRGASVLLEGCDLVELASEISVRA
jgi:transcriptional antiterminator RfaH